LGADVIKEMRVLGEEISKDENLRVGLDFYEFTREEQMATLWRITTAVFNNPVLR
jgi:alkylation response protein AidB-like acyl-CoA dehydrogenase